MNITTAWVMAAGVAYGVCAAADPVPVLAVSVHDRGPSAAQVASVVGAVGDDALAGEALRRALLDRFGRYAPAEDVLRPQREAIAAGETALFAQGRPAGRRRLQPAVAAMEAAPEALELQEDNRVAYLKGLFLLARIAFEERHPDEAETWLRRAFAFDPWWMPSDYDCPLRLRPFVARLRPAAAARAPAAVGTLSVRAPREGCTVSVDGAPSASTAQTVTQSVPARDHRVSLRCGESSRVRTVAVAAGATTELAPDPRLDALLHLAERSGLEYPTAPASPAVVVSDAAALGAALGASRVVVVDPERAVVVDARRGEVLHDATTARVEQALGPAPVLPATVNLATPAAAPAARPDPPARSVGAAPWVLVGAGAASLAAAGVFVFLRGDALHDFHQLCRDDGACPDAATQAAAQPSRDAAALHTTLAVVTAGVGVAAVAGGALWLALAPRRAPPTALRVGPWTLGAAAGLSLAGQF